MRFEDAFRVLDLSPSAGPRAVKRAFRRLAKRHHPDLCRNPESGVDFVLIVEAYTTLQREFRQQTSDSDARLCPACRRMGELFEGLDGGAECAECLLGLSRRRLLLPASTIRVLRHGSIMALEAAAMVCLVVALVRESRTALLAGIALNAAALGGLAVTCIRVRLVK